jgi:hypothetical protein
VYYSEEDCATAEKRLHQMEDERFQAEQQDAAARTLRESERKQREQAEKQRLQEDWKVHDEESARAAAKLQEELQTGEQDILVL